MLVFFVLCKRKLKVFGFSVVAYYLEPKLTIEEIVGCLIIMLEERSSSPQQCAVDKSSHCNPDKHQALHCSGTEIQHLALGPLETCSEAYTSSAPSSLLLAQLNLLNARTLM